MVETRFDCPPDVKNRFLIMSAERGETPGAMMRLLMRQELEGWSEKRIEKSGDVKASMYPDCFVSNAQD